MATLTQRLDPAARIGWHVMAARRAARIPAWVLPTLPRIMRPAPPKHRAA